MTITQLQKKYDSGCECYCDRALITQMPEEFGFSLNELPESAQEEMKQQVMRCVTALAIEDVENNSLDPIGSGTFVRWNDHFGILTAEHVANFAGSNRLKLDPRRGEKQILRITIEEIPHIFGFSADKVNIYTTGRRNDPEFGPDLAVIELPPCEALGSITARKTFTNLSAYTDQKLARALDERGLMVIAGHPAEGVDANVPPTDGFDQLIYTEGLVGFTGQQNYFARGDFDYLEVRSTRTETNLAPFSYQGVSGGSLWRVLVGRQAGEDNSKLRVQSITLAGLPFYQIPEGAPGDITIRGHGPVSVYRKLLQILPL